MNRARTKTRIDAGRTAQNTLCTPCAIAWNTTCRTAGGRDITCAGSNDPPETCTDPVEPAALIAEVRRLANSAPNAATPSEPPICWKNIRALVATPMSLSSTLFCAISETICISRPMPRPRTTKSIPVSQRLVVTLSPVSRNMPTAMTAPPTIGNSLYWPVLVVSTPASTEVTAEPTIIGVISRPLTVGLAPCTVCWYSGMNVIAPNSPRPTKNVSTIVRLKFLILNTCSGSIGSAARRSTAMNATKASDRDRDQQRGREASPSRTRCRPRWRPG